VTIGIDAALADMGKRFTASRRGRLVHCADQVVPSPGGGRAMQFVYLAIAIVAEVVGTSALKASNGFTVWQPSLFVAIGYGISFYFLSLALRTIPVGIAYAIWSGVGIVLISVIAWVAYRQTLEMAAILGIALIIAGVCVIQLFSGAVPH
jgi:small multidrug resistance pump